MVREDTTIYLWSRYVHLIELVIFREIGSAKDVLKETLCHFFREPRVFEERGPYFHRRDMVIGPDLNRRQAHVYFIRLESFAQCSEEIEGKLEVGARVCRHRG